MPETDSLQKELKDYAENLEEKVKLATAHIEEEKQKVANLLNNMKQAIFSIDHNFRNIYWILMRFSAIDSSLRDLSMGEF